MSGGQKLSDERLRKTENRIDQTVDSMRGQVRDLEDVIQMLATQWRGAGASQFTRAQRDLNDHHQKLQKLMVGIREAIAATRKSSGANDENVASAMHGIDLNGAGSGNGMIGAGEYGATGQQYVQDSGLRSL